MERWVRLTAIVFTLVATVLLAGGLGLYLGWFGSRSEGGTVLLYGLKFMLLAALCWFGATVAGR